MSNPCGSGCCLGLANCTNQPQLWRPYQLVRVCELCCVEHRQDYIRQTHERSDPDWVANHPMPEAPKPDPAAAAKAQAGAASIAQVKSCLYRGEKLGGCGCYHRCWAGPAGNGREEGGVWKASLGECVECVGKMVAKGQGDDEAAGTR